jgi:hypothetical protein
MKKANNTSGARMVATLIIVVSVVSISLISCATKHQSCEAYQNIDLAINPCAE